MKRRARRAFVLVGILVLPLLLGSSSVGAALPKAPDLSTKAAIVAYLQSINVDPATVTWQEGLLNYAGPSCPGAAWNCTTSTHVVQIAAPGGENRTECKGKPEDTTTVTQGDQTCEITQTAPAKGENHATCDERSSEPVVVQEGTIAPDGAKNNSHLHQMIGERQSTTAFSGFQHQMLQVNGQEGDIHQQNPFPLGSNHDHAHQTLVQQEASPAGAFVFQSQNTDPICCGFSQVGGDENREDIHQSTTQSASDPNADQFASLTGHVDQTGGF